MATIAGVFERLSKAADGLMTSFLAQSDRADEQGLRRRSIASQIAHAANSKNREELRAFLDAHRLYLPEELDQQHLAADGSVQFHRATEYWY